MSDQPHCAQPVDTSLPLADANARIAATLAVIDEPLECKLPHALNRVLAHDVKAPMAVPQHRNSAMDGFAFRRADCTEDGETHLTLAGQSLAGHPFTDELPTGHAVRITTGAVVPDGLDTVVVQEVVSLHDQRIRFDARPIERGQFVRGVGDDIREGETVLTRGLRLGPAELGVLASLGIQSVHVNRAPRVAVMSTGDELRSAGQALEPGQIYDSNRITLRALLQTVHAEPIDIGQVQDSPSAIQRALDEAAERSDVILSSGGVSVGVADHMRAVLEREGSLNFWKIAVKPGRPLVFGRWKSAWYFGLPGNPVSAMVTFDQIVRPALALLEGVSAHNTVALVATLQSELKKAPGRMEFQRGKLGNAANGDLTVATTGSQDSHVLTSLTRADCLIALPRDSNGAMPGERVSVIPLRAMWGLGG